MVRSHPTCPAKAAGIQMRKVRGWAMPEDEARSMLQLIEERIRSSEVEVEHRDVLIRLRSMLEDDLTNSSHPECGSSNASNSKVQAA